MKIDGQEVTFGPTRRFAAVSDGDPFGRRTAGYLELLPGENPALPIEPMRCRKHGGRIASVYCALQQTKCGV